MHLRDDIVKEARREAENKEILTACIQGYMTCNKIEEEGT